MTPPVVAFGSWRCHCTILATAEQLAEIPRLCPNHGEALLGPATLEINSNGVALGFHPAIVPGSPMLAAFDMGENVYAEVYATGGPGRAVCLIRDRDSGSSAGYLLRGTEAQAMAHALSISAKANGRPVA